MTTTTITTTTTTTTTITTTITKKDDDNNINDDDDNNDDDDDDYNNDDNNYNKPQQKTNLRLQQVAEDCQATLRERQTGHSRRLPDIKLPDMMTFIALALQMGHDVNET